MEASGNPLRRPAWAAITVLAIMVGTAGIAAAAIPTAGHVPWVWRVGVFLENVHLDGIAHAELAQAAHAPQQACAELPDATCPQEAASLGPAAAAAAWEALPPETQEAFATRLPTFFVSNPVPPPNDPLSPPHGMDRALPAPPAGSVGEPAAPASGTRGMDDVAIPHAWTAEKPASRAVPPSSLPMGGPASDAPLTPRFAEAWQPLPGILANPEAWLAGTAASAGIVAPLWMLYRRIRTGRALENENRRRILDLVAGAPGITPSDLQRAMGLHYTTCQHHLRILRECGLVDTRTQGGQVHCFARLAPHNPHDRTVAAASRNPHVKAVLCLVAEQPGITPAEVASQLGIWPSSSKHYVDRLLTWGLLEEERAQRLRKLRVPANVAPSVIRLLASAPPPEAASTASVMARPLDGAPVASPR